MLEISVDLPGLDVTHGRRARPSTLLLAGARLRQQTVLTLLARVCNTDVRNRLDYHGHQHLPRTDRLLLAKNGEFYATFHRHNAFRENGH